MSMATGLAWLTPRLADAVLIGYVMAATVFVSVPEFVSTTERSAVRIAPGRTDGLAPAGSIAIVDRRTGSAIRPGFLIAIDDLADQGVTIGRVDRVLGEASTERYLIEPDGAEGLTRVVASDLVLGPVVAIERPWAGDVSPPSPSVRVSVAVIGGLVLLVVTVALRFISRRRVPAAVGVGADQPRPTA